VPILNLQPSEFLKYAVITCRFCGRLASQPSLPWQPACAPLVWGSFLC